MIRIGEGWEDLAAALDGATPERVYVVGPTDSGKTTLCRYLAEQAFAHAQTAYVDCDTGQSRIGPPTTEGMALSSGPTYIRFVGSTSPGGHFIQTLTAAKRLVEKAAGARVTVIDSPGLVAGRVGAEFQFHMIDRTCGVHIAINAQHRPAPRGLSSSVPVWTRKVVNYA